MTKNAWKMCFIFNIEISTRHVYTFSKGTIGFLIPKNMGIDIKIVTLALLEAKLWPNIWFRWRPFWMCHKTRLRGRKNWTPIFLAYLTPNEAIKTIKSILETEMAKMTYRTRLYNGDQPYQLQAHCSVCLSHGDAGLTGSFCIHVIYLDGRVAYPASAIRSSNVELKLRPPSLTSAQHWTNIGSTKNYILIC